MQPIIEIKNISKKYKITHQEGGYVSLRDVLMNVIRSPFQFLKTKTKAVVGITTREDFWALKDVSANIYKGEIVGIIGSNGAGKSTLLKLISQITPPTEGEIIIRGTVGSLLEVGTGFHPELTGRENIFMNGSILGMTRREIAKKFDSIVEFAGVQQFLDVPVKRYSSGMYVRLAFAIAIHMDPDILIVDEVLAVGDAEFQKKCLDKIQSIAKSGRTVLFVSHNLATVANLCDRVILFEKGKIKKVGDAGNVIQAYTKKYEHGSSAWEGNAIADEGITLTRTYVKSLHPEGYFLSSTPIEIGIEGGITKPTKNVIIGFVLFSEFGYQLAHNFYDDKLPAPAPELQPGKFIKKFIIPANTLAHGQYYIEIDIGIHDKRRTIRDEGKLFFSLENDSKSLDRRFPDIRGQGYSSLFWPGWSTEG